jgi:hypothetical protein
MFNRAQRGSVLVALAVTMSEHWIVAPRLRRLNIPALTFASI